MPQAEPSSALRLSGSVRGGRDGYVRAAVRPGGESGGSVATRDVWVRVGDGLVRGDTVLGVTDQDGGRQQVTGWRMPSSTRSRAVRRCRPAP